MLTQILRRDRVLKQENTRYAISIRPEQPAQRRVVMVTLRINEAHGQKPMREALVEAKSLDEVERAALKHRVEALAGGTCPIRLV